MFKQKKLFKILRKFIYIFIDFINLQQNQQLSNLKKEN
jgi:hypothetical protein